MKWQIELSDDAIIFESATEKHTLRFSEVYRVAVTTVDLVTTDEIVLTIYTQDGTGWNIPEEVEGCPGFTEILNKLEQMLPGFNAQQVVVLVNRNPFLLRDEIIWNRAEN